jgi:hypothetical protein
MKTSTDEKLAPGIAVGDGLFNPVFTHMDGVCAYWTLDV